MHTDPHQADKMRSCRPCALRLRWQARAEGRRAISMLEIRFPWPHGCVLKGRFRRHPAAMAKSKITYINTDSPHSATSPTASIKSLSRFRIKCMGLIMPIVAFFELESLECIIPIIVSVPMDQFNVRTVGQNVRNLRQA
jgi:hypothetical protein